MGASEKFHEGELLACAKLADQTIRESVCDENMRSEPVSADQNNLEALESNRRGCKNKSSALSTAPLDSC